MRYQVLKSTYLETLPVYNMVQTAFQGSCVRCYLKHLDGQLLDQLWLESHLLKPQLSHESHWQVD